MSPKGKLGHPAIQTEKSFQNGVRKRVSETPLAIKSIKATLCHNHPFKTILFLFILEGYRFHGMRPFNAVPDENWHFWGCLSSPCMVCENSPDRICATVSNGHLMIFFCFLCVWGNLADTWMLKNKGSFQKTKVGDAGEPANWSTIFTKTY